jgi:small-conductance mechanosensitive channel
LPVSLFGSLGCQFACLIRPSVTHLLHCFFDLVIRLSFAYLVAWLLASLLNYLTTAHKLQRLRVHSNVII